MTECAATRASGPSPYALLWPHPYGELFRDDTRSPRRILHGFWPGLGNGSDAIARVASETRAIADLRSPFVLPVLEATRDASGRMVLAYPDVDGEDLGSVLARGPLPIALAIAVMRQLCRALAPVHAAGLSHRQLGPASVILASTHSAAPNVRVLDFGLASVVDPACAPHSMLVPVTPERVLGFDATVSEDVYLIGCLGYWMATGNPAFVAVDHEELRRRHAIEDVAPVRSIAPHVPVAFARVIENALAKDPDERTSDLVALERALSALDVPETEAPARAEEARVPTLAATLDLGAGSSEVIRPPPLTPAFTSARPLRRTRSRAAAVGVGGAVAFAVEAAVGWQRSSDDIELPQATEVQKADPPLAEVPVAASPEPPSPHDRAVPPPRPQPHDSNMPPLELRPDDEREAPTTSPSTATRGDARQKPRRTAPRSGSGRQSPADAPATTPAVAKDAPWGDAKIDEVKNPF